LWSQCRMLFSRHKTDGGVSVQEKRKSEAETVEVSLILAPLKHKKTTVLAVVYH
jgi:hypothetical protein